MNDQVGFVLKVVFLSTVISILIKAGAPWLAIPARTWMVLIVVCLPSLVLASVLLWRWQLTRSPKAE
ncbi:MAG: hypothetical protein KME16_25025 [Scytolyngbya sp. HA4215-MV1]|jgi:hypothetical protein|nr:hypothetical protein [Scytolyngbya sp. HA4215-MV1]